MIRVAKVDDLEQVLEIERASETAPHWPLEEYVRILEAASGPVRQVLFFAETGGFAVGRVLDAEAELESVVVRAAARRQGLGRALCVAVLNWARTEGAATIALEVRLASQGPQRLYESLGFVRVGIRPRYYSDPTDDAVLMRCRLH